MLGMRGCRLGLVYPEIYEMQIRAIARAALAVEARTGETPLVEIMHPLVGFAEELRRLRELTERVWAEEAPGLAHTVGTMIELPRACMRCGEIAAYARVLLLRHQRPHPDRARPLARRRRGEVPLPLSRRRRDRAQPVRGARHGGCRRADADRGRARPRGQSGAQDRDLRRARRRAALDRVLPRTRARLRLLLALPRPARAARGGPGRALRAGLGRLRAGRRIRWQ